MNFIVNTGGREIYYKSNKEGDCVPRAIAIATQTDYKQVWEELCDIAKPLGLFSNDKRVFETYLTDCGWVNVKLSKPFPQIKTLKLKQAIGYCRAGYGTHLTSIINGDINDTWDCRDKLAYSYWEPA
jgi:hypothetical protein